MGFVATEGGQKFDPVEAGTFAAVCVGVVDLGKQDGSYAGQPTVKHKIMVFWDIPELRIEYKGEDKPRRISARYTLSLGENARLRKTLEAWRGRKFTREELAGFDVSKLIGAPCMLSVVHTDKQGGGVYADVQAVMALPKGMPRPAIETPILKYAIEDEATGEFVIPGDDVPHWVKKIIAESHEAKAAGWRPAEFNSQQTHAPVVQVTEDDSVPF